MSTNIDIAKKNHRYSVVKYSKNTLYGLRNNISLKDLLLKQIVLKALDYDDSFNVLTVREREVLISQVVIPLSGSGKCLSC